MDIESIRNKMNSYLNSVSPEMVVKEFEKRGYNLETCILVDLRKATAVAFLSIKSAVI